jgi:F0F1-type ATP synthase epsilon subunit
MNQQQNPTLNVIARSPFHVYYEGPAQIVSASNAVGDFDILPGHADFFSVLSAGDVSIEIDEKTDPVSFKITHGIVTVRDNDVMLFVNM